MGSDRRRASVGRKIAWRLAAAVMLCALPGLASSAGAAEKRVAHLYFADANRPFLVAESRVLLDPNDPVAFGRLLVSELLTGPASGSLLALPTATALRSFFLLDDGTAVVDFSAGLRENHPGGCRMEQLTLFSVVNSLVLNSSEIVRVQILIDGEPVNTLAGHVAIDDPLTADMLLTR